MIDPTTISTLIAAIVAVVVGIVNHIRGSETRLAVQDIHLSINSRLDQMIEAADKIGYARGIKDALDAHNASIAAAANSPDKEV